MHPPHPRFADLLPGGVKGQQAENPPVVNAIPLDLSPRRLDHKAARRRSQALADVGEDCHTVAPRPRSSVCMCCTGPWPVPTFSSPLRRRASVR
jgi:hypothetical protein